MTMAKYRLHFLSAAASALLFLIPNSTFAQGVTTGAVSGTVTNEQGQPVESAQIEVVNRATGSRSGSISRSDGRFYVQGLEVGGPYTVTVRRIGFSPRDTSGVYVSLGQNARVDLALSAQATQLAGVNVLGASSAVISSSHKGIATTITDSVIARFPYAEPQLHRFRGAVAADLDKGTRKFRRWAEQSVQRHSDRRLCRQ